MIVPGLLGPVTDVEAVEALQPSLPALDRLLSRADVQEDVNRDYPTAVFAAFAIGGSDLPVAAVARLGESDGGRAHVGEYYWVRTDPVHLRIDTHNARLFGDHVLGLEAEEANGLVERLHAHFADDGLRLEAPSPGRWYAAVSETFELRAETPQRVAGRNIDPFLPTGADAGHWRRWMNEAQMLLHDAPENTRREADGRLPVNSFWPWGGGRLPVEPLESVPAATWADDPLVRGLARLAEIPAHPLPERASDWTPVAGDNLVVEARLVEPLVHGDIDGWLEALSRFADDWAGPLYQRVVSGDLDEMILAVDGSRRFRLATRHKRRWWRRSRPWIHWLETE